MDVYGKFSVMLCPSQRHNGRNSGTFPCVIVTRPPNVLVLLQIVHQRLLKYRVVRGAFEHPQERRSLPRHLDVIERPVDFHWRSHGRGDGVMIGCLVIRQSRLVLFNHKHFVHSPVWMDLANGDKTYREMKVLKSFILFYTNI